MGIAVIQPLNTLIGLTAPLEEAVLGVAETMRQEVLLVTGRFKNGAFYNPYIFFFIKDIKYFTLAMLWIQLMDFIISWRL